MILNKKSKITTLKEMSVIHRYKEAIPFSVKRALEKYGEQPNRFEKIDRAKSIDSKSPISKK